MPNVNTREIILEILTDVNKNGRYCHIALNHALEKHPFLSRRDRAFITRVCEGTIEKMIEVDYIIDQFSSVPVSKMKPIIRDIMRSAVYQIHFMGGVPDGAAVNEAVRLAQNHGFYNLKGFVNGILRTVSRNNDIIRYPDPSDTLNYLTVTYSMPEWIVRYWMDAYGPDVTSAMLESLMEEKPTTVRFRTSFLARDLVLESLKSEGVHVRRAAYLPYAYNISNFNYLPALEAFRNGWIFPQDVSSMLVGEAAAYKKDDYVIDVCAAPGGKSLHAADKLEGTGMVEARDLTPDKIALIDENLKRASMSNIRSRMQDALVSDPESVGKADVVLCDVPCSGLGVIGRKPDIKYKISMEKIEELAELQKRILHTAADYVKEGGTLIFSTCTVSPLENTENVRWFTENHPFRSDSLNPYIPRELQSLTTEKGCLQMIPGVHECDGFFIARFVKE